MELENKQQTNTHKELTSNKEILEEIKTILTSEINTDPECISLYDISSLLKQTREKEINLEIRYEEEFNYMISKSENLTGGIRISQFNYSKNTLEINYYSSRSSYKIIFSKREGDLYIVSSSDKQYAQEILVLLGTHISELFDEFQKHKEFEQIGWHYPKAVNSNFKVCISPIDISVSDDRISKTIFKLSTWHNDENVYQYKCNSNNILSEIRGNENELFKRIFIKIEDCPEWTKPILSEKRKNDLEKLNKNKMALQIQAEKKLKRQELIRKIFPFLNPQPPKITMKESEIEVANRYNYLEDKLSKLDIMQSDNRLTERTLNILFTKLRYEDNETLSLKDLEYLVNAYLMPYDEIEREIKRYDSSHPKLDAIKFVNELASRYNVDKNKIIKRIQQVRKINRVKQMNLEIQSQTKRRTLSSKRNNQ